MVFLKFLSVIGGRVRRFSLDRTGDRLLFLGPSLVLSSVSTSTRLVRFEIMLLNSLTSLLLAPIINQYLI